MLANLANSGKFRISALCRMLHSPLHSLPISLVLSRSLLCRLPGEADIRIFNFCRLNFFTMFLLYHTYFFFISIFCFSDFPTKISAKSSKV